MRDAFEKIVMDRLEHVILRAMELDSEWHEKNRRLQVRCMVCVTMQQICLLERILVLTFPWTHALRLFVIYFVHVTSI